MNAGALEISSLADENHVLLPELKQLYREYGDLLQATHTCGAHYNPQRFQLEAEHLPTGYTGQDGEIFVAKVDGVTAGCIAYRRITGETCEMKRLYLKPAFRRRGLSRQLTLWLLQRVGERGFTRVILDTDVAGMPEAHALYRSLGFREYGRPEGTITFFELDLPRDLAKGQASW